MPRLSKENTALKYGRHLINLPNTLPPSCTVLRPSFPKAVVNTKEYINKVIDAPIQSRPFNDIFKKDSKVLIILSDITRYTASEHYLPIIIDRLNHKGIDDTNITILCALGIHKKQTTHEHKKLIGSHLYERFEVLDHDAFDKNKMVFLGTTRRGTPIEVNHLLTETDHIILTGSIRFHYFAGFGGGRKSILPGVSSFSSCVANHLLVLNTQDRSSRHPLARTSILKGNPVHEDMSEACDHFKSLFLLNTILSPQRELLKAVAGDVHAAFNQGCRFFKNNFSVHIPKKADLVIASCGGYPWDINFIQAHKTMEMASNFLIEGGVMILFAECSQGFGNPRFLNWFNNENAESFGSKLRTDYEINGQTAYATFLKAKKYHIILLSSLEEVEVKKMSLIPASTTEEALENAYNLLGSSPLTYIIPDGNCILPSLIP